MDWIIGVFCLLVILVVAAIIIGGICWLVRLFARCSTRLRWHCLTALIWTLVMGIQTLVLLCAPQEAGWIGYFILLASGSVWITSWRQFAQRSRGEEKLWKRNALPVRLYVQTLWGPLALWGAVLGIYSAGQHLFEDAVVRKDLPMVLRLKDSGIANANNNALRGGLDRAVRQQDTAAVSTYLAAGTSAGSYYSDDDGETKFVPALEIAVQQDNTDITELLLAHGDSANETSWANYDSMLHLAVESGKTNQVRVLLQHGADRHVYNRDGLTPFQMAKNLGYKEIAAVLLQPKR